MVIANEMYKMGLTFKYVGIFQCVAFNIFKYWGHSHDNEKNSLYVIFVSMSAYCLCAMTNKMLLMDMRISNRFCPNIAPAIASAQIGCSGY